MPTVELQHQATYTVPEALLPQDLVTWLAEQLMSDGQPGDVEAQLVKRGVPAGIARLAVGAAMKNPFIKAGRRIHNRRAKLECLLSVYQRLYELAHPVQDVPVVQSLDAWEFFNRYYYHNKPVKIESLAAEWPAVAKWSPEYLAENFGNVEIEVSIGREQDPSHELNREQHRATLPMTDYVARIRNGGSTNDYYLGARNEALKLPGLFPLLRDLGGYEGVLDPSELKHHYKKLWFGPAGTVTQWHHDRSNIFFVQIYGSKRIQMAPSWQLPRMRNEIANLSAADCSYDTIMQTALPSDVSVHDVVARPGDAVFIPVGWWHRVTSLEASITVTFDNFTVPNVRWDGVYWIDR
jgi:hypothetical protein